MAQQIQFIDETVHEDGGYSAVVSLYGIEFAVTYSNSTVKAHPLSVSQYYRGGRDKGMRASATKRVEKEITAKLFAMPEHRKAHIELYA